MNHVKRLKTLMAYQEVVRLPIVDSDGEPSMLIRRGFTP